MTRTATTRTFYSANPTLIAVQTRESIYSNGTHLCLGTFDRFTDQVRETIVRTVDKRLSAGCQFNVTSHDGGRPFPPLSSHSGYPWLYLVHVPRIRTILARCGGLRGLTEPGPHRLIHRSRRALCELQGEQPFGNEIVDVMRPSTGRLLCWR